MELDSLTTLISNVGFPISVAIWFMVVGHQDSIKNIDAINRMSNAVDNNTKVIDKLIEK